MGKRSKGFGDLLKLERRKAKNPNNSELKFTVLGKRENNESNFEKQQQRIREIVGFDEEGEVLSVNAQTLATYRNYLEKHLKSPCYVTGIEDLGCFAWEQYYTIGSAAKKKYKQLKETNPSYRDTYELLGFEDQAKNEFYDLLVHVKRISDQMHFCLPLSDLKAANEDTKHYQLLDDYSVWFVNWR